MTTIIAIAGCPGAGKSFLGEMIAEETGYQFIDDIDDKSLFFLKQLIQVKVDGVIVADPKFCMEHYQKKAALFFKKFEHVNVQWIFFENDPEQCRKNVEKRNDGRAVNEFINVFSRFYKIPKGAFVHKVWKPE